MNNSFFNPENWLWKPFGKITDILILSAFWLFSSIPIVTIGSSLTALYDCSARCVKDENEKMFSRYFRTFRRELVPSTLSLLLWTLILSSIVFMIRQFTATATPTTINQVIAYAMFFLLLLAIGVFSWVFPLLSRFTFNVVDLNLTTLRLAITYLPRTIALGICGFAVVWICLRFWIPLLFIPGIYGLISAHILEPVFKKYQKNETLSK